MSSSSTLLQPTPLRPTPFFSVPQEPGYPQTVTARHPADPQDEIVDKERAIDAEKFAKTLASACHGAPVERLRGWALYQTKNDGHSLFRSIALLLLEEKNLEMLKLEAKKLQSLLPPSPSTQELKKELLQAREDLKKTTQTRLIKELNLRLCRLEKLREDMEVDFLFRVGLAELIARAEEGLKAGKSPRAILSDERISNGWIAFLRDLSAGWWKDFLSKGEHDMHLHEMFIILAPKEGYAPSISEYQNNITSFSLAYPGGSLEIIALSRALNRKIRTVNVDLYEGERALDISGNPQGFSPDDLHVLLGTRIRGHYDALYHPAKIPLSVLAEMGAPPCVHTV